MGLGIKSRGKKEGLWCHPRTESPLIDQQEDFYNFKVQLDLERQQVFVFSSCGLGRDDFLGRELMVDFLEILAAGDAYPRAVVLLHRGVALACEGSPAVSPLLRLEKKGVVIISCGRSLEFFRWKEKLCVGSAASLFIIAKYLAETGKVVSL